MRLVLQRVSHAAVAVDDVQIASIPTGWLALVGVAPDDTSTTADALADKVANLRAFADEAGDMNRSVLDVGGAVLVVSNFTLYADCRKGRRPSFTGAARPEHAEPLYQAFASGLRLRGVRVQLGRFGADMKVALTNDGPVTIVLDSPPVPPDAG